MTARLKTGRIAARSISLGPTDLTALETSLCELLGLTIDTDYSGQQLLKVSQLAAASGVASLNSSSKVVQDPASAQTTAGVGKIPLGDGTGKLDSSWLPSTLAFCGVKAIRTTSDLTLTNAALNSISFESERYDTDNFHSTASNTERITIPTGKAGKYRIACQLMLQELGTTGRWMVLIEYNRSGTIGYIASVVVPTVSILSQRGVHVCLTADFLAQVGDYFQVLVYPEGTTSPVCQYAITNDDRCWFSAQWLG